MNDSLVTELLSFGIQTLDENNGKYTFFTELTTTSFVCKQLFDVRIPVGSVIIAKVTKVASDGTTTRDLSVSVCCNASSSILLNKSYKFNNIQWRELTNVGLFILPYSATSLIKGGV